MWIHAFWTWSLGRDPFQDTAPIVKTWIFKINAPREIGNIEQQILSDSPDSLDHNMHHHAQSSHGERCLVKFCRRHAAKDFKEIQSAFSFVLVPGSKQSLASIALKRLPCAVRMFLARVLSGYRIADWSIGNHFNKSGCSDVAWRIFASGTDLDKVTALLTPKDSPDQNTRHDLLSCDLSQIQLPEDLQDFSLSAAAHVYGIK